MTKQGIAEFYAMHVSYRSRRAMLVIRVAAIALMATAVLGAFTGSAPGEIFYRAALGALFFALSFLMGRLLGLIAARAMDRPMQASYRFFEEGFESYQDHSMTRRPYSDIRDLVVCRGVLYLYIGKHQAYVLSREAMAGRLDELTAFFERATGRKAARVGRARRG